MDRDEGDRESAPDAEPAEKAIEPRVPAQGLQIGIAEEPAVVGISQFKGPLQGEKTWLDHAKNRVGTGQVIPGDRVVGGEPNQPPIKLEGPGMEASGGQIAGLGPQRVDEIGITLEQPAEEIDLEVKLCLPSEPPPGGLGGRVF